MKPIHCLICTGPVIEVPSAPSPPLLSAHLGVVFLLRQVLEVPAPLLITFLENTSFPRVDEWISVCDSCGKLVRDCRQVHEQLCKLQRKWRECQARVVGIMQGWGEREGDIEEAVEQFVMNYKYNLDVGNPFEEGDNEARDRRPKQEIVESSDDDYDNFPESSPVEIEDSDDGDSSSGASSDYEEEEPVLKKKSKSPRKKPRQQYPCTHCKLRFILQSSLTSHLFTLHGVGSLPYSCSDCDQHFAGKQHLANHRANHCHVYKKKPLSPEEVRLVCPVPLCPFQLPNPRDLVLLSEHQRDAHTAEERQSIPQKQPRIYECLRCLKRFGLFCNMRKHLAQSHERLVNTERVLCLVPNCTQICASMRILKNHQRNAHTPQEVESIPPTALIYECPACSKRFREHSHFQSHNKRVHGPPAPQQGSICDKCGASFPSRRGVQRHRRRNAQCSENPEKITSCICPTCGKTFPNRDSLQNHRSRVHPDPERLLTCEICQRKVVTPEQMRIHLARVHRQGDFPCGEPGCGKVLWNQNQLEFHVNWTHKGVGGLVCGEEGCGKRFKQRKFLENHVNKEHRKGPPGYPCGECGKGFYFWNGLYQHKRLVHNKNKNATM